MIERQDILDSLAEKISKHGWTAVSVHGSDTTPPFTYSIGFHDTFNAPEVVILGVSPQMAHSIVSGVAHQLKHRLVSIPGTTSRLGKVIQDFDVEIRPIPEESVSDIARLAVGFAFPRRIQLVQIILPDQNGRLPGEPGCNPDYEHFQDIDLLLD